MEEKELLLECYESTHTPLGYFIGQEEKRSPFGILTCDVLRVGFVTKEFLRELLTPIERFDSDFSPRTKNCLKKLKILCLGDLVQQTPGDILQHPSAGHQTVEQLREFLREMGLQFGLNFSPSLKEAIEKERKRKD